MELTPDELAIYHDIGRLAEALWQKSVGMTGTINDVKLHSAVLFKRLWTHRQAYTQLWNEGFYLEGEIIARSAIETAICLAALKVLRDEFVVMMRQDAAHTLMGRIKMYRDEGAEELVAGTEQAYQNLTAGLPEGKGAAKLDFKQLAKTGNVPLLYSFHKTLSGVSSHVTGLSIIKDLGGGELDRPQAKLKAFDKKMQPMMMASAVHTGAFFHAILMDDDELIAQAMVIGDHMNVISESWPGVGESRN